MGRGGIGHPGPNISLKKVFFFLCYACLPSAQHHALRYQPFKSVLDGPDF